MDHTTQILVEGRVEMDIRGRMKVYEEPLVDYIEHHHDPTPSPLLTSLPSLSPLKQTQPLVRNPQPTCPTSHLPSSSC